MVGSDHDFNWHHGYTGNAGERAAFANGQEAMQPEIDKLKTEVTRLQEALADVLLHLIQIADQSMTARGILARALDDK